MKVYPQGPHTRTKVTTCPHCCAKRIDEGHMHGHTRAGLPWCGVFNLFDCGLVLVNRWGGFEVFHPCRLMLDGIQAGADGQRYNQQGKRVVDAEAELGGVKDAEPPPEVLAGGWVRLTWASSSDSTSATW